MVVKYLGKLKLPIKKYLHSPRSDRLDRWPGPEGEPLREVDVGGGGCAVVEAGREADKVAHLVLVLAGGIVLKLYRQNLSVSL